MIELAWVIVAYLLGSIPFGILFARFFCRTNPQEAGSGNIGATNVTRLCGLRVGLLTLLFDAGKGAAAVEIGIRVVSKIDGLEAGHEPLFITATGLAVILGHMYSVFLKFKGGKAVATTIGVFAVLALPQLALSGFLCVVIIWWKKYVSLGSLVLVLSLPIILFLSDRLDLLVLSLVAAFLVANAHKPNIKRLISGQEKPWRSPKAPKE